MLICLNGQFVTDKNALLPIQDGSYLFGDSLFETLKAHGSQILLAAEHLDRMELSAKLLDFPCDRKSIEDSLQRLSPQLTAPTSRIRLTISRGSHSGLAFPSPDKGWHLITATAYAEPTWAEREAGINCVSAPNRRVNPLSHLPQMKRGNYADCLYAGNYARKKGASEALFSDQDNHLLEGSSSNLFALIDHQLITPAAGELVLAGTMRRQILKTAAELGIPVREGKLKKTELLTANEAFISNSLIDLLPINSFDGQPLNRGEIWKKLLPVRYEPIGS